MIAKVSVAARDSRRGSSRVRKQVRKVGSSLEMPATTALDEFDPVPFIMACKLSQCDLDVAVANMFSKFIHAQRTGRREQGRFDGAHQFVHQAALFSRMGSNGPSWAISRSPRLASSSAARKLEARQER